MNRKTTMRALWSAAMMLVAISLRGAQPVPTARGFDHAKVHNLGSIDNINSQNGNLVLTIPLGMTFTAGDRLKFQLNLIYNSSIWDYEEHCAELASGDGDPLSPGGARCDFESVPARDFNAGVGWRLALGELTGTEEFIAPDGVKHAFHDSLHFASPVPAEAGAQYTRDGSYLRKRGAAPSPERRVDMPDGTTYTFHCGDTCNAANPRLNRKFRLTRIEDAFGNAIVVSYGAAGATWAWTLEEQPAAGLADEATTHTITFARRTDEAPYDYVIQSVVLAGPHNTNAAYSFGYERRTVARDMNHTAWKGITELVQPGRCDSPAEDCSVQLPMLTSVTLPNGAGTWSFDYEPATPDDYSAGVTSDFAGLSGKSGRLDRVTFPTGGIIRYEYGPYTFVRVRCQHRSGPLGGAKSNFRATGVVEREMVTAQGEAGGVWRYGLANGRLHDYTPDTDEPESCSGVYEYWTTTFAPFQAGGKYDGQHVTVQFFHGASASTHAQDQSAASILQPRFHGLPFSPLRPDEKTASRPVLDRRYLSTKTYRCTAGATWAEAHDANGHPISNPACTPLRETWVRYEQDPAACLDFDSACRDVNSRVVESRTVALDDRRTINGAEHIAEKTISHESFDGLGHFRKVTTAGNYNRLNFPAQLPRQGDHREVETFYNRPGDTPDGGVVYNPAQGVFTGIPGPAQKWVINTYSMMTVRDFDVDANGAKAGGAASVHAVELDHDPATGYLRRKRFRRGNGGTRTNRDRLTEWTRTISNGSVTESEGSYGGDQSVLPEGWDAPLPGLSLGSPEYVLVTQLEAGAPRKVEYARCPPPGGGTILVLEANDVDGRTGLVLESAGVSGALTTDPARHTRYEYDSGGRLTKIVPPGGDATTVIDYSRNPATVVVERKDGAATLQTSTYLYDGFGRPSDVRQLVPTTAAGVEESSTQTKYLPTGAVSARSTTGSPVAPAFTDFREIDPFGRAGRIRQPDGTMRVITHFGERIVTEGVDGTLASRKFDSLGRLVQVVEEKGSDIASDATYEYDSMDHVIVVRTAGQTRRFEYDGAGLLVVERPVELAPNVLKLTYDARGNLLGRRLRTAAGGSVAGGAHDVEHRYDGAERLTGVFAPASGSTPERQLKGFTYHPQTTGDLSGGLLASTSRANTVPVAGALATTRTVDVREDYRYDPATARMRTRTTTIPAGPGPLQVRYTYDKLGNVSGIRYPCVPGANDTCASTQLAGAPVRTVAMTHKQGGHLTSIPGFARNILYNLDGTVGRVLYENNAVDVIVPDASGLPRPASMQLAGAGQTVYQYDGRGNITQIGKKFYEYDGASRLTRASSLAASETFSYDRNGNLTSLDGRPVTVDAATNRLADATYDAAGNVKTLPDIRVNSAGVLTYQWDRLDRMTHSAGTKIGRIFVYDANDERVGVIDYQMPENDGLPPAQQVARELWTLRGADDLVLRELESRRPFDPARPVTWRWVQDYVHRGSAPIASIRPNGSGGEQIRTLHVDHLGTPRFMTAANGQLAPESPSRDYSPFGTELRASAAIERLEYTGHERDDNGDLGAWGDLDAMHARYYAPFLGRFLSLDPVGYFPDRPQSWNRYSYALNNPVLHTDPDGRCVATMPCPAWAPSTTRTVLTQVGQRVAPALGGGVAVVGAGYAGWKIGRGIGGWTIGGQTIDTHIVLAISKVLDNIYAPDQPLPTDPHGNAVPSPDAAGPHTQLGKRTGSDGKPYPQGREWDAAGRQVRRVDFTDHGRPKSHPLPHQHDIDPKTGKVGEPKPMPEFAKGVAK